MHFPMYVISSLGDARESLIHRQLQPSHTGISLLLTASVSFRDCGPQLFLPINCSGIYVQHWFQLVICIFKKFSVLMIIPISSQAVPYSVTFLLALNIPIFTLSNCLKSVCLQKSYRHYVLLIFILGCSEGKRVNFLCFYLLLYNIFLLKVADNHYCQLLSQGMHMPIPCAPADT